MSRLRVLRDGAFRCDARLKESIADIVATSFVDNVGLLEIEFERRDTLYLLQDERGEVLSFFMVSWDTLEIDGRQVPTLNAGLTAARPDQKGTGKSIRLYRHVVSEAQERERLLRRKLIVWGTLASPIAYRIARKVFADLQPALDGTYSDDSEQVARAVRRKLGIAQTAGAHPFVFPRLVAGVRFTEAERRRLADVCRAKSFSLFDRLGIGEARGDRLLFVGAVPATPTRTARRTTERPGGKGPAIPGCPRAARNGGRCS
jgi:hypothetical protein